MGNHFRAPDSFVQNKSANRRHVLKSMGGLAAASLLPVSSLLALADDRLLSLGAEFEELWAWEKQIASIKPFTEKLQIEWDGMYVRLSEIAKEIAKLPAKTIEGFRIKARAVSWCHSGEIVNLGDNTTDILITNGIIADLLDI